MDLWVSRAQQFARQQRGDRVGIYASPITLPCAGTGWNSVSVKVAGFDVPARGNCLYHAVWTAAELAGVRRPFNMSASAHVFDLRVQVGMEVVRLLRENTLRSALGHEPLHIGELVARPNQWQEYSGEIPITAMAYMLQRRIVTLSADGIFTITPNEPLHGELVVIYHCAAGRVGQVVSLRERNHYVAVSFESEQSKRDFADIIRSRSTAACDASDGTNTSGLCRSTKRKTTDSLHESKVKRPRSHVKCDDKKDEQHGHQLSSLVENAMNVTRLTTAELDLLGQNFMKHPRLALLYFHCCGTNPDSCVFNDEKLSGPDSRSTVERLLANLDVPMDAKCAKLCQDRYAKTSGSSGDIWACASCCEMLNTVEDRVRLLSLHELHPNFRLLERELETLREIPSWIVGHHLQVYENDSISYHLNPDLVPNLNAIPLCEKCAIDPRKSEFSIAAGHDYGRPGGLPELGDVATKCISPVRTFKLEISVSGKHSVGHCICFPSSGPAECSKVLPCTSVDCIPRVTFVGPNNEWQTKRKGYENLFLLPAEDMYSWLRVLSHTHQYFKENHIEVDDSPDARRAVSELESLILEAVTMSETEEAKSMEDKVVEERFCEDYSVDAADTSGVSTPIITKSAVLKDIDGVDLSVPNAAVEAMITMLDTNAPQSSNPPIVTVRRSEDPVVEWFENGNMIAAAFPCLFMKGGKCLPEGTWPTSLIKHLMRYYDGRFEKNTMLVATLFNQLQRHSAIRKAAQIGSSRATVLLRLGELANSETFRKVLLEAKANPESSQAKRVNAHLLRILSLVGACVPFSAFERATSRPRIGALRARYGIPQHWVTIAPPEHYDLELHRIAALRELNAWNRTDIIFQRKECSQDDLPDDVQQSARARLAVSNAYPALSARVFERCVKQTYNEILLCRRSSDTRISRAHNQRESGAFGTIAAHAAVVEPQADGRLHIHMSLYGSNFNPTLLSRIMVSAELRNRAANWLESVCCMKLSETVHQWRQKSLEQTGTLPKSFQIALPDAGDDFANFLNAAQMRTATTNFHSHTSTCFKGKRGKYMCRLARPSGIHESETSPLMVVRERKGNHRTGVRPIVVGHRLQSHVVRIIEDGCSYSTGEAFHQHCEGPLLWEIRRPETDKNLVETNLVLTALTCSHTNASVINGEDSGDMIEEYQQAYMTKEDAPLKGAASALLSAEIHNQKFPSKADDSQSKLRIGKYLATRTVNSFSGAHEWSHALMVYAITGHRSFLSSDAFWYVFPHALVEYVEKIRSVRDHNQKCPSKQDAGNQRSSKSVEVELAELVDEINGEDDSKGVDHQHRTGSGVRTFRIDGEIVFLTQAESYFNRGEHFVDFSPLEFECIVDIVPIQKNREIKRSARGRPSRDGFLFATTHPLFKTHHGVIRAKMLTATFGGAPPPTWKNCAATTHDEKKCDELARYLLSTFSEWDSEGPKWSFNAAGLLDLCATWDRSSAPLISRERCRYIKNLMKKGHRSSHNEQVATDWRNRGADYWESTTKEANRHAGISCTSDSEFCGVISSGDDLYELLTRAATGSATRRAGIASIKSTFSAVFSRTNQVDDETSSVTSLENPILTKSSMSGSSGTNLSSIATSIQTFETSDHNSDNEEQSYIHPEDDASPGGVQSSSPLIAPCDLSNEQFNVVRAVLDGIDQGRTGQTLTVVHGGGGTGKSFIVRRISQHLHQRQYKVVSTCPTGAGACQLSEGRTFHSALKCGVKNDRLSAQSAAHLRHLFGPRVALVVVDEISMFKAKHLVLLDKRLRQLYDHDKPFGGKSILLTGDFWQLQVVKGISICKCMYMQTSDPELLRARHLFSLFTVFPLQTQHRARDCTTQQELLERFRMLPRMYPDQNRWGKNNSDYHPINSSIVAALARPLTQQDTIDDDRWLNESVILVTSNTDREVLNTCMAKELADRSKKLLFRWRKPILDNVHNAVQGILYNELEHPELYGYFYYDAPGQVLDNANGNVTLGVANGTRCWYHSMSWENEALESEAVRLTEAAVQSKKRIVDLPVRPQFINVRIADRDGGILSGAQWPNELNLETNWVSDAAGQQLHKASVVIPVGTVQSHGDNYTVKLDDAGKDGKPVRYEQHAVDLALALTVWKAQGSTFERVVTLLEGSSYSPSWQFEHVYVAMSRVRSSENLRCLHTTLSVNPDRFYKLRPSVFTVKWLLDLDKHGRWNPHQHK